MIEVTYKELSIKVETLRGTPFEYATYNGKAFLESYAAIYEALNVEAEVLNSGIAVRRADANRLEVWFARRRSL